MNRRIVLKGVTILFLFCLAINLLYFHLREFQGEEGRRVIIAMEMIETGEWIVPHMEGEIYLNKPPLYNWLLGGMFALAGTASETTARIPSVLMAFLGALCLSLFWRSVAQVKNGWFVLPGLIFLTFPDVLDKAIRAEIDMTFAVLITLTLLSWYYFHEVRRKPLAAWLISGAFLGLSVLTKGIQAPAFFYCAVIPYLVRERAFRKIFSLQHVAGIAVSLVVFALWFVPLVLRIGWSEVVHAWVSEILVREEPLKEGGFIRHLLEFPLSYLIAYLPWLFFLGLWFDRSLRPQEPIMKKLAWFCFLSILFSVPFYWIVPGARIRYLLPLSGLLALFLAVPLHWLMSQDREAPRWCGWYGRIIGGALILVPLSLPFWGGKFAATGRPIGLMLLGGLFVTGLLLVKRSSLFKNTVLLMVFAVFFAKLSWAAIYFPYHEMHLSHYRTAAAEINRLVPSGLTLYDYNVGNAHLTFYLKRPVTLMRSLDDLEIGNAAVFAKRDDASEMPKDRFSFLGEVKARRVMLAVYRHHGTGAGVK